MRIGIHTGNFCGGMIGKDVPRYEVYGKDILIANKMESNGIEGKIVVSETTKNLVQKRTKLKFDKWKMVEA